MGSKEIVSDIRTTFSKENLAWYGSVMSFHTFLADAVGNISRGDKAVYSAAFASLLFWGFSNVIAKDRYLLLAEKSIGVSKNIPGLRKIAELAEKVTL